MAPTLEEGGDYGRLEAAGGEGAVPVSEDFVLEPEATPFRTPARHGHGPPHAHGHAHASVYVEGNPRLLGALCWRRSAHGTEAAPDLRVRRRAVWAFFLCCSVVTLVLSSSCDGIIRPFDGVRYLYYRQVDFSDYMPDGTLEPQPFMARSGFQCTAGGEEALDSSLALIIVTPVVCASPLHRSRHRAARPSPPRPGFSALAIGTFISCRGGCATATPTCAWPDCSVESLVGGAHKVTLVVALLCMLLWSSHLGLMSEIMGACSKDENEGAAATFGSGAEQTYAELGFSGDLGWNATAQAGVAAGRLREGYFVSYYETRSLRGFTRALPASDGQRHLYGGAIGAAVLGALALLLQIPVILYSQRAISQKAARGGAAAAASALSERPPLSPFDTPARVPPSPQPFYLPPSASRSAARSVARSVADPSLPRRAVPQFGASPPARQPPSRAG